ncbi:MAG: DUF4159 domain-containing protein [Gemmatimonadota bacterium]
MSVGRAAAGRARVRFSLLLPVAIFGVLAVSLVAQVPRERYRGSNIVVGEGPADRSAFTVCRLAYTQVRREEGGSGWDTELVIADQNLMFRLADFTNMAVLRHENGTPAQVAVRATDEALFACPFLVASDPGSAGFDPTEVERLREYLLKGGFLWADDFWGERALDHWLGEIGRVLPEYETFEVTSDHPLMSAFYFVDAVPQIPNIRFWRSTGGQTSERGFESAVPRAYAIADEHDRILVFMTHNTDIADGWEREGEDFGFFHSFSPYAYALAVNVVVAAMTR